jgi:threonine/homoserine/homoserine lactone efflux protein
LAYTGGVILLSFGFYYLFIKSKRVANFDSKSIPERSAFRLMAKGFIINGLSPMVLIFWIGTVGVVTTEFGYTSMFQILLFFSSIVATVFATDIIKAKLADKLRDILTPKIIRGMNFALGVLFILFGGRLILFADQIHL